MATPKPMPKPKVTVKPTAKATTKPKLTPAQEWVKAEREDWLKRNKAKMKKNVGDISNVNPTYGPIAGSATE
jgi:hypothetical protein